MEEAKQSLNKKQNKKSSKTKVIKRLDEIEEEMSELQAREVILLLKTLKHYDKF